MIGDQGKVVMRGNKVDTTGEEKNGGLLLETAEDLPRCEENPFYVITDSLILMFDSVIALP